MRPQLTNDQQFIHRRRAQPLFIMAALMIAYVGLASPNLTYDGAAFIAWFHEHGFMHPQHPLWGYFLNLCLNAGRAAGLSLVQAGQVQSAITAAAAAALYFAWLRRLGIGMRTATLFGMLLGLSGTAIEIATTVELYGVALLAVMLSLHAWLSELREPDKTGAVELWIACWLVVALQVAWALWVLAIYVTLAWNERERLGRALGRILEGAAVAVAIAGWLWWGGAFSAGRLGQQEHFFSMFARGGPFLNFFSGFVVNGGLLLCAGIFGAMRFRKSEPALFLAWILATFLFFAVFGFWIPDRGEFFLPVTAIWGYFSARTLDEWALGTDRPLETGLGILVYAGAILGAIWLEPQWIFAVIFWVFAVASAWFGRRAAGNESAQEGKPRTVIDAVIFVLTLALYLPPAAQTLKPDAVTKQLNIFTEVAPTAARLVTAIPPYRPFAQTGHESLSIGDAPGAAGEKEARVKIGQWVNEIKSGGPSVWFDERIWGERKRWLGGTNWEGLSIQHETRKGAAFWGLTKD